MKRNSPVLLILGCIVFLFSNSCGRTKDPDELVLGEYIIEENGIYYRGDCEVHIEGRYTGTDSFYHDNGKLKGTYTLKNGLPDGHLEQYDTFGAKKVDLYFDTGDFI